MIVSCKGDVDVNGNRNDVYAEFGCICGSLLRVGFAKEELAEAIVLANILNEEERKKNGKRSN